MRRAYLLWIVAMVVSMSATALFAGGPRDRTEAHVVTRSGPAASEQVRYVSPTTPRRDKVHIVHRPVVEPAATVSRDLSEQPVRPHLAELVVVNTPITVDPHQDFRRATGGIPQDHYLWEAQRQWLNDHAKPARVIQRPAAPQRRAETIQPRAVIEVPGNLKDGPKPMPQVPAPPKKRDQTPSLVQAD